MPREIQRPQDQSLHYDLIVPVDITVGAPRLAGGKPPSSEQPSSRKLLAKEKPRAGIIPNDAVAGLRGVLTRTFKDVSGDDVDYETQVGEARSEFEIAVDLHNRKIGPLRMAKLQLAQEDLVRQAMAHGNLTSDQLVDMEFQLAYNLLDLYPEGSRSKWLAELKRQENKVLRARQQNHR